MGLPRLGLVAGRATGIALVPDRCIAAGPFLPVTTVYAPSHRLEWLAKIVQPGVRVRAEHLYEQLDNLQPIRQQARRELLLESHKHSAVKLLRQIPSIGRGR